MDKNSFIEIDKLYHYTSFDSALKILLSKSLRFGRLASMNDINESYRGIFYNSNLCLEANKIQEALSEYLQISFTSDTKVFKGYNIPSMWGHYADRGYGVCLVFDKEKLLSYLEKDCWCGDVVYNREYNNSIDVVDENVHSFFYANKEGLFFTKTIDWQYEQEFRVVKRNNLPDLTQDIYFQFKDSLLAIILNFATDINNSNTVFDSLNVKMIKEILPNMPILELGNFREENNLRDSTGVDWTSRI